MSDAEVFEKAIKEKLCLLKDILLKDESRSEPKTGIGEQIKSDWQAILSYSIKKQALYWFDLVLDNIETQQIKAYLLKNPDPNRNNKNYIRLRIKDLKNKGDACYDKVIYIYECLIKVLENGLDDKRKLDSAKIQIKEFKCLFDAVLANPSEESIKFVYLKYLLLCKFINEVKKWSNEDESIKDFLQYDYLADIKVKRIFLRLKQEILDLSKLVFADAEEIRNRYDKWYDAVRNLKEDVPFSFGFDIEDLMAQIYEAEHQIDIFYDNPYFDVESEKYYISLLNKFRSIKPTTVKISNFCAGNTVVDHMWRRNQDFYQSERSKYDKCPELYKLNDQQAISVYNQERFVLVNAGAGCGKSTTIIGKVRYLLESGKATPDQILLISFTRNSVKDLNSKLERFSNLRACTFHKIGRDIIGVDKAVVNENESLFKMVFEQSQQDKTLYSRLWKWMAYCNNDMMVFDEKHPKEYVGYLEKTRIKTLRTLLETCKGEFVRSQQEAMIANFLFENGIEYEYEPYLKLDNRGIRPDFLLTEYGIYIEHWAVGLKDGKEVTPWTNGTYVKAKEEKLERYKRNNIKLVESFSYDFEKGKGLDTGLEKLAQKLKDCGVKFSPISEEERIKHIEKLKEKHLLSSLENLLNSFLNLFKSAGYSSVEDMQKVKGNITAKNITQWELSRYKLFFDLFEPCLKLYQASLEDRMDFNDMIIQATNLLKADKRTHQYKYIIIDEFQDISRDLMDLVKALQRQTSACLFCVGDDWQSIYRFKGGDVGFFMDFEKDFPDVRKYEIGETFRSGQNLIDLSSMFIKKNPAQSQKYLKSRLEQQTLVRSVTYGENNFKNALEVLLDSIAGDFGPNCKIMLLLRNRYDLEIIKQKAVRTKDSVQNDKYWSIAGLGQNNLENITLKYEKYPNISFDIKTVHGAKGLESDIVVIFNLKSGTFGFPSQRANDILLEYFLCKSDEYPYAEERRLFYVALTRAKHAVYLFVPEDSPSIFYDELMTIAGKGVPKDTRICPKCQTGHLILRKKDGHLFYGCSNYGKKFTSCDYTEPVDVADS